MKSLFDLRGLVLLSMGWIIGLGWFVILTAIRATHVSTVGAVMPYLLIPVWLLCLCLVAAGTYDILAVVANRVLRLLVTLAAVLLQCFAFFIAISFLAVYVHLWAGGHL